ncbi:alkaline phosphatase family protein [Fictibacillus nanhaiensis]|uniref:alkaline phosphatase family protein n=1 Tax=Fictibacillus nanhaiensis TaxID=742169 RepID=UPI001C981B82|nr:alkaline phosphatase family protein [Fictibacillus nanhaiensis]MBY6035058.1 alkaline phosphatase family protein [Fictibacillus nanhaiensis]
MSNKLAFIMLDGLQYKTSVEQMGYLGHLAEEKIAARYLVKSEVPSMSRPLYEVLLTGTLPHKNGILSNQTVRLSKEESLFHLTKKHGLTNATASYYWVSELYNKAPFEHFIDRYQHDPTKPIQHGIFYSEDHYPDSHLFADAHYLMEAYQPDFLYVHSMNIDDIGHKYTANSKEYRGSAIRADIILANILPLWMEKGYQIIITADHGMNDDGDHGGTLDDVRDVPLFVISDKVIPNNYDTVVRQLHLAPLACHLLGIPPSKEMISLSLPGLVNK